MLHTTQKMKFSVTCFFNKYDQIRNEKLHFLCSPKSTIFYESQLNILSDFFTIFIGQLCPVDLDLDIIAHGDLLLHVFWNDSDTVFVKIFS